MSGVAHEDRQHQAGGASAQLHYAPSGGSHRRTQRGLIVAALLFFSLSAFIWGPGVWTRTNFLYYQWRLGSATPPAGTIVLDSQVSGTGALPPLHAAFWKTWRGTHNTIPTNVVGAPVWSQRMTTVSGNECTVTIYATDEMTGNGRRLVLRAYAADTRPWYWIVAPTRGNRQGAVASLGLSFWQFEIGPQEQVLVEAAQLDLNDHTHVLIPYDIDGETGTIRVNLVESARPPKGAAIVKFDRYPIGPLEKRSAVGGSSF